MTTRIAHVLAVTEQLESHDFCESAELTERRFDLLKQSSKIVIKDVELTEVDDLSVGQTVYTKDGKHKVHAYMGSIEIMDIEHGMKAGKTCKVISLSAVPRSYEPTSEFLHKMATSGEYRSLEDFVNHIETSSVDTESGRVDIHVYEKKSKEVFNPFNAAKLKRLVKMPKRWNADAMMKAIANGQFSVLKQDSYLGYDEPMADPSKKDMRLDPLEEIKGFAEKRLKVDYVNELDDGQVVINYGAHSNDARSMVFFMAGGR